MWSYSLHTVFYIMYAIPQRRILDTPGRCFIDAATSHCYSGSVTWKCLSGFLKSPETPWGISRFVQGQGAYSKISSKAHWAFAYKARKSQEVHVGPGQNDTPMYIQISLYRVRWNCENYSAIDVMLEKTHSPAPLICR